MIIDFLRAADGTPFTKKFTRTATGELLVEPFPNVRDVDSIREEVLNIEGLYQRILYHAGENNCLLKGRLARPLKNESRAGLTDANAPTQWLLLDLDFDSGWDNPDTFLTELNPAWADVSYVWQHSSSAGIKAAAGLRGHLWLMLEASVIPASIKLWLKSRNLEMEGLRKHMTLTATGMSVKWPLDITTCGNDKLIYIAPPMLEGLTDPLTDRITLVKKAKDLAPSPRLDNLKQQTVDVQQDTAVAQLRRANNLPARTAKYATHRDAPLLTNPSPATVTGIKTGNPFTYLNLDGGDSWGYYFNTEKPDLLYNFKDEPLVRLQTIAPEFYQALRREQKQERFKDVQPYVFRNLATDTYYNALYSKTEDRMLVMAPARSKDRLADFLAQYAEVLPDPIPDWTIEFDPTTTKIIDPANKWVNLFEPSEYVKHGAALSPYPEIPPTIDKVLNHVMAGCPYSKDHFLNWLACLVQTRTHIGTSWVFHGVQGTGKGLLLNKILNPLLGSSQVTEWTTKDFEDSFNAALEHTCLLWLDEFKASSSRNTDSLMSRLKNVITEPTLPVRAMRTDTVVRANFVNVIVASNFPDPIALADNDRRFNIAPPQETALVITSDEVTLLDEELLPFASFLMHFPMCRDRARTILLNGARTDMIGASQTSQDAFFAAVRYGDLDYFTGFIMPDLPFDDVLHYQRFETVVRNWAEYYLNPETKGPLKVSRNELSDVFRYVTGIDTTPSKFSQMAAKYRSPMKRLRIDGALYQGVEMVLRASNKEDVAFMLKNKKLPGLRVIQGNK